MRGELRGAGERSRRHDDCREGTEAGRIRENAVRQPEEDRARREWECRAHPVSDARLRIGHVAHEATLDSGHTTACCHNRSVKIVVSGASGLIGTALVPSLRNDGHEVLRLVRREPAGTDEIRWDPATDELDTSRLHGVDALVNLSGENLAKRWTNTRKRAILDSRVQSTELLARTAAALDPKPSVLVVASAVGVYGDRGDEILTEESAAGAGFLADVVRAWEAAADPAREAGIRVAHLRQGIVISKDGGALKPMLLPFKLGVGGRVGSGKQWWSWVGMDDLVGSYAHVLAGDLAGAVNVTAPNPVTNEQFTKALGSALHRPTVLPVPAFAARTLFGEMGDTMLLGGQRVLPARLVEAGFDFSAPTIDIGLERALAG